MSDKAKSWEEEVSGESVGTSWEDEVLANPPSENTAEAVETPAEDAQAFEAAPEGESGS